MHMADALISVAVGGTMIVAATGVTTHSIKKLNKSMDEKKIPLMGVMGAFVFAVQMINFSIPGTGSSGHLAGALLLAIILGPYAGFVTMASVLIIQALVFADGGLLALGCNIINIGFYTCFIAYPLIYKPLMKKVTSFKRILPASLLASIIGLQLGAFSVVIQTLLSGKTELPFGSFLLLMQPIHLAIAVVEGLVTAAVVIFVKKARPEILEQDESGKSRNKVPAKGIVITMVVITIITAGVVSWFASSNPDGLEWSIFKVSGQEELEAGSAAHTTAEKIQDKTAILPDYMLANNEDSESSLSTNIGTTIAGLMGVIMMIVLLSLIGITIVMVKRKKEFDKGKAG